MRSRSGTALLSIVAIAALLVVAGCGGGGDGNGGPTPPPPTGNPQIQSISAPDTAFPGSAVSLSVNATHPNGLALSYTWTASGGVIDGSGSTVTWVAPVASGNYSITVRVSDTASGQAQESVTITVDDIGPPPPPPF